MIRNNIMDLWYKYNYCDDCRQFFEEGYTKPGKYGGDLYVCPKCERIGMSSCFRGIELTGTSDTCNNCKRRFICWTERTGAGVLDWKPRVGAGL